MRYIQPGWVRIGRYDAPQRRSTWARLDVPEGPPDPRTADEDVATAVELCSGREGDDAYVRVERGDPAFFGLLDVVSYSIANVDHSDERIQLIVEQRGMWRAYAWRLEDAIRRGSLDQARDLVREYYEPGPGEERTRR